MILFLCAVLFFPVCDGFLLVNNTGGNSHGGNSMTDEHYVHVMGLVSVDRQNLAKMEKFVLRLQTDMNTMKRQINGQNQNHGTLSSQEIIDLKMESQKLNQTIFKLQDGYQSIQKELNQVKIDNEALKQDNAKLKQDNIQLKQEIFYLKQDNTNLTGVYLQSEIVTNRNNTRQLQTEMYIYGKEISNLKKELDVYTKPAFTNASILQQNYYIQLLNNKMDKMSNQLNTLTSSSNARGQDFIALLQETNTAKQDICNLQNKTKQVSGDLQNYKTNTTTRIDDLLQKTISMDVALQAESNKISSDLQNYKTNTTTRIDDLVQRTTKIGADLQNYKTKTTSKIDNLIQRTTSMNSVVQKMNKRVALTAYIPYGTISAYSIPKFTAIITVIGISDIDRFKQSGKFTCEVAGVYLFSVFISSDSYNRAGFSMYKNITELAFVSIYRSATNSSNYHTGTGVVAVSLIVGDTLYLRSNGFINTFSHENGMTIIKIG